jgi:fumarate reductase subunit C
MPHADLVAGVGLHVARTRSRWPARLDFLQSATGLALGAFLCAHLVFESSILVSPELMYVVTKAFEGTWLFGSPYPVIISIISAVLLALLLVHALLALRKFPSNYRQARDFAAHRRLLAHGDTSLWWVQVVTGFLLFFVVTVHLYQMMLHPGDIGPFESADRVWTGRLWPLYVVLLAIVVPHGAIGLYRLALKWGWQPGSDAERARGRLKAMLRGLLAGLLLLGAVTLVTYARLGYQHREHAGERYLPPDAATAPGSRP